MSTIRDRSNEQSQGNDGLYEFKSGSGLDYGDINSQVRISVRFIPVHQGPRAFGGHFQGPQYGDCQRPNDQGAADCETEQQEKDLRIKISGQAICVQRVFVYLYYSSYEAGACGLWGSRSPEPEKQTISSIGGVRRRLGIPPLLKSQ